MSYSLNIHIWLDLNESKSLQDYISILLSLNKLIRLKKDTKNNNINQVRFFDKPFSETVNLKIERNETESITNIIEKFWSQNLQATFDCLYQILKFDGDIGEVKNSFYPLDVTFNGTNFGEKGFYHERFGHIEISFHNVNNFSIPQDLIKQIQDTVSNGDDSGKFLSIIPQLSSNYKMVVNLLKEVITLTNPLHILVCTESDLNPLVAHTIYHRNIRDFVTDLTRISYLHEFGGSYFSVFEKQNFSMLPPWKSSPSYGHLRGRFGNKTTELFKEELESLVNFILSKKGNVYLSSEDVKVCIENSTETEFVKWEGGYLLSSSEAPFSYIEAPYFCLYKKIKDGSL